MGVAAATAAGAGKVEAEDSDDGRRQRHRRGLRTFHFGGGGPRRRRAGRRARGRSRARTRGRALSGALALGVQPVRRGARREEGGGEEEAARRRSPAPALARARPTGRPALSPTPPPLLFISLSTQGARLTRDCPHSLPAGCPFLAVPAPLHPLWLRLPHRTPLPCAPGTARARNFPLRPTPNPQWGSATSVTLLLRKMGVGGVGN